MKMYIFFLYVCVCVLILFFPFCVNITFLFTVLFMFYLCFLSLSDRSREIFPERITNLSTHLSVCLLSVRRDEHARNGNKHASVRSAAAVTCSLWVTQLNLGIPRVWEGAPRVTHDTVESVLGGKVLKLKGSYFCHGRGSSSSSTARRGTASLFSAMVAINSYLYETPSDVAAYSGFFCSVKCSVAPGRLLSISLLPPSVDPACLPPVFSRVAIVLEPRDLSNTRIDLFLAVLCDV